MSKTYLSNAFSLNMIDVSAPSNFHIEPVTPEEIANTDFISVIGHPDTANVVASILGCRVEFNRCTLTLEQDDILLVAQYKGPRLEEGATKLPDGATIEFLKITRS